MPVDKKQTYDFVCFTDLVYEFSPAERKSIEQKIKRRLKYHNLGKYSQERVDYIRTLKGDLYDEISSGSKSKYYSKSDSAYAALNDFDIPKMTTDYAINYRDVNEEEIRAMISFAIYSYHLR